MLNEKMINDFYITEFLINMVNKLIYAFFVELRNINVKYKKKCFQPIFQFLHCPFLQLK